MNIIGAIAFYFLVVFIIYGLMAAILLGVWGEKPKRYDSDDWT